MAERVVLHVGPPKTGTTYLQAVAWRNRRRLREGGVTIPLARPASHAHAVASLRGDRQRRHDPASQRFTWERFVSEAESVEGTVLLSAESFAAADEAQVARAVETLSPADVHVVVTARDFTRQVPSLWQQHIKQRGVSTLPEYVTWVRRHRPDHWWRAQCVPGLIRRWMDVLPDANVHLATVPARGQSRSELWHRFAAASGIDHVTVDTDQVRRTNAALTRPGVEVLRRTNIALGPRLPLWRGYVPAVRHGVVPLIEAAVDSATADQDPIRLDREQHAWAAEIGEEMVREIDDLPIDVVGDLSDLLPGAVPTEDPEPVPEAAVEELSDKLLVNLIERQAELSEETHRLQQVLAAAPTDPAAVSIRTVLRARLAARLRRS